MRWVVGSWEIFFYDKGDIYKIKKLNCTLYHFLRYLHIGCVIIFEILLFAIVRDKIF